MCKGQAWRCGCACWFFDVKDSGASGKVAQPAHRVKDKRLRRAFGILDTARWLGFMTIKGLLPTPVEQG